MKPAAVGEAGGAVVVPLTLTRSTTFFERVALAVRSLPSGWTATLDNTSLLGWTANATTLRLTLPNPTRAGTYRITVDATNQGRVQSVATDVVVENDLPTAKAVAVAMARGKTGPGSAPAVISWAAATDKTSAIAGYEVQFRRNGGAWYAVKSALGQGPLVRPQSRVQRDLRGTDPGPRRRRQLERLGGIRALPGGPRRRPKRDGQVHRVVGEDQLVGRDPRHAPSLDQAARQAQPHLHGPGHLGRGADSGRVEPRSASTSTACTRRPSTCAGPSTHNRRVIFTKAFASSGKHKITLEIVSAGRVQLDGFIVLK